MYTQNKTHNEKSLCAYRFYTVDKLDKLDKPINIRVSEIDNRGQTTQKGGQTTIKQQIFPTYARNNPLVCHSSPFSY